MRRIIDQLTVAAIVALIAWAFAVLSGGPTNREDYALPRADRPDLVTGQAEGTGKIFVKPLEYGRDWEWGKGATAETSAPGRPG